MQKSKKVSRGKIRTLAMIGAINLVIFSVAIYFYSQTSTVSRITRLLPKNWIVLNVEQFISEGVLGHNIVVQSTQSCIIPAHEEKGGRIMSEKTIFPNISIKLAPIWSKEDIQTAQTNYANCQKEIENRPMMAQSCKNTAPLVTTNEHSVFIDATDCNGEANEVYNTLISYFKNLH